MSVAVSFIFFVDPVFALSASQLRTSNNGWYQYACIHAAEISNDELTPPQNVARLLKLHDQLVVFNSFNSFQDQSIKNDLAPTLRNGRNGCVRV